MVTNRKDIDVDKWIAKNRSPYKDWLRFGLHGNSMLPDFIDNSDPEIERYLAEHNGD